MEMQLLAEEPPAKSAGRETPVSCSSKLVLIASPSLKSTHCPQIAFPETSRLRSKAFGATRDQRGKTNPSGQHSVPALATSSLWVSVSATAPRKASLIRPKVSKRSFYFPSGWPLPPAYPLPRKPTLPSHLCGSHLCC